MKSPRVLAAALLLAGGAVAFSAVPAFATEVIPIDPPAGAPTDKCADLTEPKQDTEGNPLSVEISAPDGFVITMYCVKSGSDNQGDGPLYFEVVPPTQTLTISYPDGRELSHYSFAYEKAATTPPTTPPVTTPPVTTPPETTPATPPASTTPPAGGGDGGTALAETGFENGWLAFIGIGALALGGALIAPRLLAKRR